MVPSTAGEERPPGHCWRALGPVLNATVLKILFSENREPALPDCRKGEGRPREHHLAPKTLERAAYIPR